MIPPKIIGFLYSVKMSIIQGGTLKHDGTKKKIHERYLFI